MNRVAKGIGLMLLVFGIALIGFGGVVMWGAWMRHEARKVVREELDGKQLWVVGRFHGDTDWSFQGAYQSEGKAIEACIDEDYFIGPATLNGRVPHERMEWPGSYYPLLEPEKIGRK